jgi:hypothetical protein
LKPIFWQVNAAGTLVSEKVHLREIVVIPGGDWLAGRSVASQGGRLPFAEGADISAATPISAFQGRNHGD